jgi:uncharacterized protein YjbI with pentapeptide repeats
MKQNKSVQIIFLSLILSCFFLSGEVFANKESDLKKLKSTNSCPKCDLSNANLRGANLNGANLSGANLNGVYLIFTNLKNADLSNADLRNADLSNADLSNADLRNADLRNADLRNADLSGANLRDAKLSGIQIDKKSISTNKILLAKLEEEERKSGEVFANKQSDLEKLKSTKSCPKCDLSNANLRYADLPGADLRDAKLRGADLRGANLGRANLSGANLRDANLTIADLRDADLSDADLSDADLSGAYLSGAYVSGADLSGANVTGCKFISKEEDRKIKTWTEAKNSGRCKTCRIDPCGNYCMGGTINGSCSFNRSRPIKKCGFEDFHPSVDKCQESIKGWANYPVVVARQQKKEKERKAILLLALQKKKGKEMWERQVLALQKKKEKERKAKQALALQQKKEKERKERKEKERKERKERLDRPMNELGSLYQSYVILRKCHEVRKGYTLVHVNSVEMGKIKSWAKSIEKGIFKKYPKVKSMKEQIWEEFTKTITLPSEFISLTFCSDANLYLSNNPNNYMQNYAAIARATQCYSFEGVGVPDMTSDFRKWKDLCQSYKPIFNKLIKTYGGGGGTAKKDF